MSQEVQEHIWAVGIEDNREQPICKRACTGQISCYLQRSAWWGHYILIVCYSLGKNIRRKIKDYSDWGQEEVTLYRSTSREKSMVSVPTRQMLPADEHGKPTTRKSIKREKRMKGAI